MGGADEMFFVQFNSVLCFRWPISVAARSEAWSSGLTLGGTAGFNPTGSMGVCCEFCVLSVEVSLMG